MDEPSSNGTAASETLRVRLFSVLRERVGQSEVRISVPAPVTGTALLNALAEKHPALAHYRQTVRLAVNERYAREDARIPPGSDVALVTPVSGG